MSKIEENLNNFKNLSFDTIGEDGFINYRYNYDKETNTLIELINGVQTNEWSGKNVIDQIKKIMK